MHAKFSGLAYLYCGSADVDRDLAFYCEGLGGKKMWRHRAMGADVAGVRIGPGPTVVLADHRPVPSVLPIWTVVDLDSARGGLEAAGWNESGHQVEIPDGPCLVLSDPSGNEIGLLHRIRPNAMSTSTASDG